MDRKDFDLPPPLPEYKTKCELCNDTGVVIIEMPESIKDSPEDKSRYRLAGGEIGHKGPGWYRVAEQCPCRTNSVKFGRFRTAQIPAQFGEARLESARANQKETAARLRNYLRGMKAANQGRIFAMSGASGVGKTWLLCAALNDILDRGGKVRFLTSHELCEGLRDHAISAAESSAWIEKLCDVDLLGLDDLGAERVGNQEGIISGRFADFLKRYDAKGNLILTTNYENLEESLQGILGKDGGRVATRLARNLFNGKTERMG